jgi:hypothetical protein
MTDKRMLSVADFCRLFGIGRTLAYSEMKAGRLRYCLCGRKRLIRTDDAEAWSLSIRQPPPVPSPIITEGFK